ncbi:MAG: hypothetical protein WCW16_04315 [Candidatus Magasanikbacteria bacterium]
MFDDVQPKKSGQVPGNLPITEPEDIFSGADVQLDDISAPQPAAPTSALDAGVLKPRQPISNMSEMAPVAMPPVAPPRVNTFQEQIPPVGPAPEVQNSPYQPPVNNDPRFVVPPQQMGGDPSAYTVKEPLGSKKAILWIIIGVIVIVLGAGSAWMYFTFIQNGGNTDLDNGDITNENITPDENTNVVPINTTQPDNADQGDTANTQVDIDQSILFGQPIDTDGDGLDDVREADLNTDPLNWDSDGDELSDGDEVTIWKTDPLDSDSDNDGYGDGAEIKNGYSPTGSGKLFEVPTTTESAVQ